MLALVLAAALSVASGADTVVMNDGSRITGTVIEESPKSGVTIRVDDGTIRRFDSKDVARVEFSDGTRSTLAVAAEEPAPAPPLPAAPQAAPPPAPASPRVDGPLDTVYFIGGGRVRGVVLEESPREGVTIRLLDGTVRTYARSEIQRIQYADGSVSRRREAPPRSPPPVYQPAPPPRPEPAPVPVSPRPLHRGMEPGPLYLAAGVGGTFFGGEAEEGLDMDRILESQAHFSLETGLRLSPSFAIGLYGDIGAGDPAREQRDLCDVSGFDCFGTAGRIGFLVRGTFDPTDQVSKWVTVGTGWEFAQISDDSARDRDLFTYTGREYLRLGAGFDFRGTGVVGVGFYGSVGWGEFHEVEDDFGTTRVNDALHTTVQLGVRLTLFP